MPLVDQSPTPPHNSGHSVMLTAVYALHMSKKTFLFCRSVSATYQWGGVVRLDLVSAPPGTALVFYGPPALHVHAMPLLSQHDLVQSAAALAAQHRTSQHDSAQHDSAQHDSAQHDSAQHDSAQTTATEPNQSSSQRNGSVTSHSSQHHGAWDAQAAVFTTLRDTSQVPHAADSEADDGGMPAQHSPDEQLQDEEEEKHLLQAELHAAAGEEDDGGNAKLFAETSVLARGGLKVTEKASLTSFDCLVCGLVLMHDACHGSN